MILQTVKEHVRNMLGRMLILSSYVLPACINTVYKYTVGR